MAEVKHNFQYGKKFVITFRAIYLSQQIDVKLPQGMRATNSPTIRKKPRNVTGVQNTKDGQSAE